MNFITVSLALLMAGSAVCRAEESKVTAMNKEDIRLTIRSHIKEVRDCYEARLKQKPNLEGKAVLEWTIESGGKVTSVKTTQSIDPEVDKCLEKQVASWKFPEPPKGDVGKVIYPFYFSSNSSSK